MNYKDVATEVLAKVGGKANVKDVTHCVTRLRFTLINIKIKISYINFNLFCFYNPSKNDN